MLFEGVYKTLNFVLKNCFSSWYIIMESLRLEEENIIKDIRNIFRLRKRKKLHSN